jgi:hypothetical protein
MCRHVGGDTAQTEALGAAGITFLVVAAAAPLTIMTENAILSLLAVAGVVWALALRVTNPQAYARIGGEDVRRLNATPPGAADGPGTVEATA